MSHGMHDVVSASKRIVLCHIHGIRKFEDHLGSKCSVYIGAM